MLPLALLRPCPIRTVVVDADRACALAQRVLQADRASVLLQQVREGLVGQLLERAHAVARIKIERRESRGIERHAFADRFFRTARHGSPSLILSSRKMNARTNEGSNQNEK